MPRKISTSGLLAMPNDKIEAMIGDVHILITDGIQSRKVIITKRGLGLSNPIRDTYYPKWRVVGTFDPDVQWDAFRVACLNRLKEVFK